MRALVAILVALMTSAVSQADFKLIDRQDAKKPFVVFKVTGNIAYPLSKEFKEHFAKVPKDVAVYIHINSPGGSLIEGTQVIATIRAEQQSGREVNTIVENGEKCASMCVPIFLQGTTRMAGEIAAFMFHGVTKAFSNIPDVERTKLHLKMYEDAGVDQAFIDRLWEQKVFELPGQYWMSGKELFEQNTGVLNRLLDRHVIEEPVEPPFDPSIRPRSNPTS